MNTASFSAKVHFHGTFWVIVVGDTTYTCLNRAQLLEALSGRPVVHKEPPPPPSFETVEQFLARGGTITRITQPRVLALPRPVPETKPKPPTTLTLQDLGFI